MENKQDVGPTRTQKITVRCDDEAALLWKQMKQQNDKKDSRLPGPVIFLIILMLAVLFAGLWVVVFQ